MCLSTALDRTRGVTALDIDSVITPRLQGLAGAASLEPAIVTELDSLLSRTDLGKGVVVLTVWLPSVRYR